MRKLAFYFPRHRLLRAAAGLSLALMLTGCLHRRRAPLHLPGTPQVSPREYHLRGLASWYGEPYQGRPTASGEIYNMYAMTAAHRTLPFGTLVRVHDLANGRSVDVRINDRGPFVRGRIIDLSYAAAERLGIVGTGTAPVQLEILNPEKVSGPGAVPGIYAVQVGAFRNSRRASRLAAEIKPRFGPVQIQPYQSPVRGLLFRVRVGRLTSEGTADLLARDLKQAGLASETYVVRLN